MKRTVLITGSSRGLGEALALAFARDGWSVIIHGRHRGRLARVKKAVQAHGSSCTAVQGDLTAEKTIEKLAAVARQADLDILVNNAAAYMHRAFLWMEPAEILALIETNLVAPLILTRRLSTIFFAKADGMIININSLAGKRPGDDESIYCATKHGLRGFSSSLQFDATRHGIRMLDVYLGAMQTAMTHERPHAERFIDPNEAADLIVRLTQSYRTMNIREVEIGRRNY